MHIAQRPTLAQDIARTQPQKCLLQYQAVFDITMGQIIMAAMTRAPIVNRPQVSNGNFKTNPTIYFRNKKAVTLPSRGGAGSCTSRAGGALPGRTEVTGV